MDNSTVLLPITIIGIMVGLLGLYCVHGLEKESDVTADRTRNAPRRRRH